MIAPFLLLPGGALAQSAAPTPDWLEFRLAPADQTVVPAQALVLSEERGQALRDAGHATVELLERYDLHVHDGWNEERLIWVRHFLTDEGVQEWGNLTFGVSSNRSSATLEEMYVLLPDGQINPIEPGTVQVQSEASPDIFSDAYDVTVPASGLVTGATAVLVVTRRTRTHEWPLPWSRLYFPQGLVPVEQYEVLVDWDSGLARPIVASDADIPCESNGDRSVRCSLREVDSFTFDTEVASWYDLMPHLVVSQPQTWPQLVELERAAVDVAVRDDDGITQQVKHLLEGKKSPVEALKRIHRFVADEVRYVAFEHGVSAIVPHPAGQTLHRRYGDCKDKVALFLALARAAGLEADPVLVATERYATSKLITPSWRYFDHMIACVDTPPEVFGTEYAPRTCVDVTAPGLPTGVLPRSLHDAVALDLAPGTTEPHHLPAPPHGWDIELETLNEIDCDGRLVETMRQKYVGAAAWSMRSWLRSMTEQERREWLEASYQDVMGDTTAPTFDFEGLDGADPTLTIVSTTEYSDDPEGVEFYDKDPWITHFASDYFASNRHYPYPNSGLRVQSDVTYRVCRKKKLQFVGAELDFESEFGKLVRQYRKNRSTVTVKTTLDLPRAQIALDAMDRYNRFLSVVLDQLGIWFSYEGKGNAP